MVLILTFTVCRKRRPDNEVNNAQPAASSSDTDSSRLVTGDDEQGDDYNTFPNTRKTGARIKLPPGPSYTGL